MRAGSEITHKDLASILALGAELGVALPLAELTERRSSRIYGFDDNPAVSGASLWSGIRRERE